MSTRRFHLSLNTALALGFGAALTHALTPSIAAGSPAGAAVSYGANPVTSAAGTVTPGSSETALSAPADQDLVITDAILAVSTSEGNCMGAVDFALQLSKGYVSGRHTLTGYLAQP